MSTLEKNGYEFERPNQEIKTPVIMEVAKVIANMRSNALFLAIHGEDENSRNENEIIERTLRSVMSVINDKTKTIRK